MGGRQIRADVACAAAPGPVARATLLETYHGANAGRIRRAGAVGRCGTIFFLLFRTKIVCMCGERERE